MKAKVHQLVHGYQKGHSLLAGSCSVPKSYLEIVTELSDLSGPLPAGTAIPSYITAYPVAGTGYYALGRTWPDVDAPRSGCVITHTLLIPLEMWATAREPSVFLHLHTRPDRQSLDNFRSEIGLPTFTNNQAELDRLMPTEAEEFASKVFESGLRSVIWFDCGSPDAVVMALASLLWPALRGGLYAHTFSLHAHAKVKSDLQLHFAPRSAQSHFSRVPKQCQMIRRTTAGQSGPEKEWIREIAEDLRAGRPRDSYIDGLRKYGHLLGHESSAVRNLFALRDLTSRMSHTPTAAIGILDIIDSLEPAAESAAKEKQLALETAISASLNSKSAESLRCLSLIDSRLHRPSFEVAGIEVRPVLRESVKNIVASEPHVLNANSGYNTPSEGSVFWQGVVAGIQEAAKRQPSSLISFGESPAIASFIVGQAPHVACAYLHSHREERPEAIAQVVQWIRHVERDEQRQGLRRELLPEVGGDESAPLLEELLRDLSGPDVEDTLNVLAATTQGFGIASLRKVVIDFVSQRFPEETIAWSQRAGVLHSRYAPEVVAEAFLPSQEGLDRILAGNWNSPDDLCEVWSAFIDRIGKKQLPHWFVRRASEESATMEPFAECQSLTSRAIRALEAIGEQCAYLPLARSRVFRAFIEKISNTPLNTLFISKACDSAISEHIAGRIDGEQMLAALRLSPSEEWCEQVSGSHVHGLLVSTNDRDSWQRAWSTLSLLPCVLFGKVAGPQIISEFTRSFRAYWTEEVAKAWTDCLARANCELSHENSLRLNMLSLSFCLNSPRLPLGSVMSNAFPRVYEAVSSGKANNVTDEMFGYFDWDKAKKLRKDAINAYISSIWPAEDLALVAARCQILRKVIHRLQRKWGGDKYIRTMMDGLDRLSSPEAVSIRAEVSKAINDPDFFEPWD